MKKHFKGFTLIECLIALAILGIASLTMAQIYASVAKRNRNNQLLNTSISNQMAYVEKYTGSEAVPIYYNESGGVSKKDPNASDPDRKPPHKSSGSVTHKNNYVQITRIDASKTGAASRDNDQVYSFPVDTFILLSRDDMDLSSGTTTFDGQYYDYLMDSTNKDSTYNLRYKYLTGHAN